MYGIVYATTSFGDEAEPVVHGSVTAVFRTHAEAVEGLRNAHPGSRVVECDPRGNPVVRTPQPVVPAQEDE